MRCTSPACGGDRPGCRRGRVRRVLDGVPALGWRRAGQRAPGSLQTSTKVDAIARVLMPMAALHRALLRGHGDALPPGPARPHRRRAARCSTPRASGERAKQVSTCSSGSPAWRRRCSSCSRPPRRTLIAFYLSFGALDEAAVHDPLEQVDKEIEQRTDVVGIFPNDAAVIRLAGALLLQARAIVAGPAPLPVESMALILAEPERADRAQPAREERSPVSPPSPARRPDTAKLQPSGCTPARPSRSQTPRRTPATDRPRPIRPAKRRSFAPPPRRGRHFAARCAWPCRAALDWTAAASLSGSRGCASAQPRPASAPTARPSQTRGR